MPLRRGGFRGGWFRFVAGVEEGGSFSRMPTHGHEAAAKMGHPDSVALPRGFVASVKRIASCWLAKVLEMDSEKPRARRRVRTAASFAAVGWAMTMPGVGSVLAKRL